MDFWDRLYNFLDASGVILTLAFLLVQIVLLFSFFKGGV